MIADPLSQGIRVARVSTARCVGDNGTEPFYDHSHDDLATPQGSMPPTSERRNENRGAGSIET